MVTPLAVISHQHDAPPRYLTVTFIALRTGQGMRVRTDLAALGLCFLACGAGAILTRRHSQRVDGVRSFGPSE